MNNTFEIQIESDGKIRIVSPGGFADTVHADADRFLAMVKELAGGSVEVKNLKPNLANPMSQSLGGQQQHRH